MQAQHDLWPYRLLVCFDIEEVPPDPMPSRRRLLLYADACGGNMPPSGPCECARVRFVPGGGIVATIGDLAPHTPVGRVVDVPGKGGTRTCACVLLESILKCNVECAEREKYVRSDDPEPYVALLIA